MKKVVKLTESDLVRIVKRIINEQEIYDRTIPTDTIASKTTIVGLDNPNTPTKLLYLTPRDKNGNVIGKKLTYSISGKYSILGLGQTFNITMRNIKRYSNGDLGADVKPDNETAYYTMKKLIPSENLTADGWLMVRVPTNKINDAINQLKKSSSANIDAGFGVSITLKNI